MKIIRKQFMIWLSLFISGIVMLFTINYHVVAYAENYKEDIRALPNADAILVLGAYVFPDGRVSDVLRDRLDTALEIYREAKSPKIIVSGDHGRDEYDEVNTMKQYLLHRDLHNEDVFMDHAGFNTYESIYRAKEVFKVKKLIIVTQDYHLSRALYIARKMGLEAYGVSADKMAYRNTYKYKAREILARNKDFVYANITKPKPTYLGEAIPITSDGSLTNDK